MRNIALMVLGAAALATGCGRQSEATPLPAPEVVSVNPTGAARVGPTPKLIIQKPLAPPEEKSAVVPAAFTQDEKPPASESKPLDKAGKLVADFLRPKDAAPPLWVEKPRSLPGLRFLEKPALPTTPFQGRPPRLAVKPKGKPVMPHPAPEDTPLFSKRTSPRLPVDIQLPAGTLVSWPGATTDEPPTLPTLAQHQPDRTPLADPTTESSTAAALAGTVPLRTAPAPFVRVNVPDPFEHREAGRLRTPPAEDPTPMN